MKKWLIFLLALLVMAGSSFPCCPIDNCQDEITTSSSKDQNHQEKGSCSPFFACAACAGFVHTAKNIHVPEPVVQKLPYHEKLTPFLLSVYYSSLFQPPRNAPIKIG